MPRSDWYVAAGRAGGGRGEAGDVGVELVGELAEVDAAAGAEHGAGGAVEDFNRAHRAGLGQIARPFLAVPLLNHVAAGGEERRSAAIVEHLERPDLRRLDVANGGPGLAVPAGDVVDRLAIDLRELSANIERWTAAVVKRGERMNGAAFVVDAGAQGRPFRAVPLGDPVGGHTARRRHVVHLAARVAAGQLGNGPPRSARVLYANVGVVQPLRPVAFVAERHAQHATAG